MAAVLLASDPRGTKVALLIRFVFALPLPRGIQQSIHGGGLGAGAGDEVTGSRSPAGTALWQMNVFSWAFVANVFDFLIERTV
jgi:hypothetical protein